MGFVMPWLHPANAQAPTMRVLSFNVNSAHSGEAQVVAEIERYDPDLVLLQETGHHATREALASLLAARYPTVQVAGQLILATRYPQVVGTTAVDGTPATPSDAPPPSTGFQRVELDTPLGHLAIYNVHTVSPRHPLFRLGGAHGLRREITSGRLFLGGGAPELHENADQRAAQVQAFAEAAARETDPVLIAGDTNLPGQSPILRRYLSAYDDAFTQSSWGFGYTFPTNKWRPWMRIDRVMARGGLRFVGFRVGEDRSASDHLCVVADVQAR
jgi:endonuclease/exonuclease/phosphatase (EEP) superfamily protein YafD